MKKIILLLTLLMLSTSLLNASKDVAIDQQEIKELNKMSDPKSVQSASDSIEDWAYSAIRGFGVGEFGEYNGKFFFFASQSVSLKPNDPQFGDALINAYDKALMQLQGKYLMARFGRVITNKVKQFYSNRSTDAKEIEVPNVYRDGYTGKILNILDKSLDVTDKKLDAELIKLGTPAQELEKMTPIIKKDIFRDKFIKNSIRKASGSIAGLFPIQTSLAVDKRGQYVVGIVAIATQKTIQVTKDIRLQRYSIVKGDGKRVEDLLPKEPKDYLSTFGVRLSYDIDGTPMIISYGIGSYTPSKEESYIDDQLKIEAKQNAISNADAQIAEIVNGYMNINESRKNGEEIRKYVERKAKLDSDTIEKTVKNIIRITNNSAKSSASASLKGVTTVKTWRHTTNKGVKFVGAVRVWRYKTLKAINNFNSGKSSTKKKNYTYKKSIIESKKINDINDF